MLQTDTAGDQPVEPGVLAKDLHERLAHEPLEWKLVVTLGDADDPTTDATKAWPDDRPHVDVGTLVVFDAQSDAQGACSYVVYNPLVLPEGIEGSDNPLLDWRTDVDNESYQRRIKERADL